MHDDRFAKRMHTSYHLIQIGNCKLIEHVWAEYFPDIKKAPCRTTLGITALPTPIAIELKCIAAFPENHR